MPLRCQMLTHDSKLREGICGADATVRDGTGRALCQLHGDLHVRIHNGTLHPLTGEKIVGFDVDVEFGVPPRVETFHWRGTEAAVRRKAIFKSHFRRVVVVRAITDSEWNRGFGDPALRESLYRC